LPNGKIVPHMQRGAQPPIFAEDRARYPVLLFSHGFGGSPISSDYIEALKVFASHGYVVVAPFHGDSRIVDVRIDSLDELLRALLDFPNYTAMQAIRPRALSAALDVVLADPGFAARIDASHIGGFGASAGGESLLLMRGAQLTVSIGLSSKPVINDTRLRAGAQRRNETPLSVFSAPTGYRLLVAVRGNIAFIKRLTMPREPQLRWLGVGRACLDQR